MRWPAFHVALLFKKEANWQHLYKDMLRGNTACLLEIHDRQKKIGFAMSVMPATVVYEQKLDSYVASYLSANSIPPEVISCSEEHRLRFCPASVCDRLQPGITLPAHALPGQVQEAEDYPNKVLQGIDGLEVGAAVELQWKMQERSPFGWWLGKLEALQVGADSRTAQATVIFTHFCPLSRWHRLSVRVGSGEMLPCHFGGFTGGLRAVSPHEAKEWARFFPKDVITF